MQSLHFHSRDCVFLFQYEKETRTKTHNPFNAIIISFESSAFAIVRQFKASFRLAYHLYLYLFGMVILDWHYLSNHKKIV
jgi:hypothetical protein